MEYIALAPAVYAASVSLGRVHRVGTSSILRRTIGRITGTRYQYCRGRILEDEEEEAEADEYAQMSERWGEETLRDEEEEAEMDKIVQKHDGVMNTG